MATIPGLPDIDIDDDYTDYSEEWADAPDWK